MATWSALIKSNTTMTPSVYPAVWDDGQSLYVMSQLETAKTVRIYDPSADDWSDWAAINTALDTTHDYRQLNHLWISDGKLYVMGPIVANSTSPAWYSYGLSTKSSVRSAVSSGLPADCLTKHCSITRTASDDIYYCNWSGKSLYKWNVGAESWDLHLSWSGKTGDDLYAPQMTGVGDKLYFLGGLIASNDLWQLDPTTGAWNQKNGYPHATQSEQMLHRQAQFSIGSYLFVWGGEAYGSANDLRCGYFDPSADDWTMLDNLSTAHLYASGWSIGSKAYIVGGRTAESGTNVPTFLEFTYRLAQPGPEAIVNWDPATSSVTITWADVSGDTITGYIIQRREQLSGMAWVNIGSAGSSDRTFTDYPTIGKNYWYRVVSYQIVI